MLQNFNFFFPFIFPFLNQTLVINSTSSSVRCTCTYYWIVALVHKLLVNLLYRNLVNKAYFIFTETTHTPYSTHVTIENGLN